jgi:hypothetical protein
MGTVTGTTQDKLHLVKTYDPTQPYIVGRNGVTAVYTDTNGVNHVEYIIDGIEYHTLLIKDIQQAGKNKQDINGNIIGVSGIMATNINNPINSTKSFVPDKGRVISSGKNVPLDIVYPTTFKYTTQPRSDETSYFVFKDEVKMGVVFTPKVEEEVFIERQSISVFEPQTRLGEIITLEGLEEYNNGYYNIIKNE